MRFTFKKGEAARIFTGAPIPENGDTVIPQEDVLVENGMLKFQKK
jgi:molybdopterin biosynthesis enzyme